MLVKGGTSNDRKQIIFRPGDGAFCSCEIDTKVYIRLIRIYRNGYVNTYDALAGGKIM